MWGLRALAALGVLAVLSPGEVARAVEADDDAPFRRVSGIGPKTAKLIVVSLAGKLAAFASPAEVASVAPGDAATLRLVEALAGLGWSEKVAQQAAAGVVDDAAEHERGDVPLLLRRALQQVGRPQAAR